MKKKTEDYWMSIADMMSGLMMVFLLITVAFLLKINEQQANVKKVVTEYSDVKKQISEALNNEFAQDLKEWGADPVEPETLTIRFKDPETLFAPGSHSLNSKFKSILDNLIPRYVDVIAKHEEAIQEIRIEGHTSSEWNGQRDTDEAYLNNMELSQARTRSVLEYILKMDKMKKRKKWLIKKFTANGLSYSHLIFDANGREDEKRSRRVEIKLRTNAEQQVEKIVDVYGVINNGLER